MQLLRFWREMVIVLSWVVIGVMYAVRPPECPPAPVVTTTTPVSVPVSREEEVKRKVTKITKKPSGAVIKEVTETETISKEKSKIGTSTTVSTPQARHKYSLGVYLNPLDYTRISADIGARLGDLPLEVVGGFNFYHNELTIGLRYNF